MSEQYLGPLAGLNVIDFGHYYAGPMAAMLLADQGANVIHVVRPGESELPSQQYRLLNRNKKILTLDLKTEEDKAQALSLIEKADVLVENFRPDVMQRLGLDYISVKEKNPSLIYLSLPGFASTDKERSNIQAWEGILSAAAGFYRQSSHIREILNYPPLYTWVPLCSAHGSMQGATAIMAALVAREKHGHGTVIEVPLVEAGLSTFLTKAVEHLTPNTPSTPTQNEPPEIYKPFAFSPEDDQKKQLKKLQEASQVMFSSPLYTLPHTCADGRKIVICCPGNPKHVSIFMKTLGLDKQLKQEGFINEGPWELHVDNNLSAGTMSKERTQRLKQLVTEKLLTKSAYEWETLLGEAGFPISMVRTRDEWFSLEPMSKTGIFTDMSKNGKVLRVPGKTTSVSNPDSSDYSEPSYREAEFITIDEALNVFPDNREIITSINPTLQNKGDLLKGLKVLDLSNILAGPFCSYTLALYGAEVIRVEPEGEGPGLLPAKIEQLQGKRSILLDIKTEPGKKVLEKLIRWADVFLHNSLDDVAQRLGVSHKQVQEINKNIISCQLSAFGGTRIGGWENRSGYDATVQSACGLMISFGSKEVPRDHGMITCGDTMTGVGAAFSTLLGVYQYQKTGFAGEARISLAQGMNFTQLPFMISENGNSDWGEAHGQFAVGQSPHQRLYACEDDWVYVGTSEENAYRLAECVTGNPDADEASMEGSFSQHDSQYWVQKLQKVGIACYPSRPDFTEFPIREVDNHAADETIEGFLDILHRPDHPGGLKLSFAAPTWVRVGEHHSYKRLAAPPRLGENTREVLAELGYSQDQIDQLFRLKIAKSFMPALGPDRLY